jgi:HEAT repeat protein
MLPGSDEKIRPEISLSRDSINPCEFHFPDQTERSKSKNPKRRSILEPFFTYTGTSVTFYDSMLVFLNSADSEVRIAAAEALGRLGDSRAIEPLFRACMDEDRRVKQAAREALSRLSAPSR